MPLSDRKSYLSEVITFFDRRAHDYNANSKQWPWSWQRRREATLITSFMGEVAGYCVLDLGCGAGFYTHLFLSLGARHVTAVDVSSAMVSQLPTTSVTGIIGDAATVHLNKKYDLIVCAGMLEFTPEPIKVLENARKHAAHCGVMVILAPIAGFWGSLYRLYHRFHGLNIHLFQPFRLKAMAENSGWNVLGDKVLWPFTLVMKLEAR